MSRGSSTGVESKQPPESVDTHDHDWVRLLPGFLKRRLSGKASLQRILGNTGWLFGERALRMCLGLFIMVTLARFLGPERFGLYNYSIAFILLFSELTSLGLNSILVRDIVQQPEHQAGILGTAFFMRLLGGVVSFCASMGIIWLIRPDDQVAFFLVAILSGGAIFRAFEVVDFYFQSRVESRYVVIVKSSAFVIFVATSGLLILLEASLFAFVAAKSFEFALTGVGFVIMYQLRGERILCWHFDWERAKGLIQQSWPLILSGFGSMIYLKMDQVMLGEMIGEAEVGIYAVAVQFSEIWYFAPLAIAASAFPSLLTRKQQSVKDYQQGLQRLYDVLMVSGLVIAVSVSVFARPVVEFLYGETYAQSGVILTVHIWACVFIFMRAALSKWFVAESLFMFSLVTHGVGALMNVGLNFYLIPNYGGIGAAIATVVSYAGASYFSLFLHRATWPAARMMTFALLCPIRIPLSKYRTRGW